MSRNPNIPFSNVRPIRHVRSLARVLGVSEAELLTISNNSKDYWIPGRTLQKRDGQLRRTSNARGPLKQLHEKINSRFLRTVYFPQYLMGSIPAQGAPRDYKTNAEIHVGSKLLITEDIENFFPSTTTHVVRSIWQLFFQFHPEIAEILTQLTTYEGSLPQGWKTSSHLANLTLWDVESTTYELMRRKGYRYSRYVDDICVSSRRRRSDADKRWVVSTVCAMLARKGYRMKRSKHSIVSDHRRMSVTGLNLGATRVSVPKTQRDRARALIYRLEKEYTEGVFTHDYDTRWNSVSGIVASIKRFHEEEASRLRRRLDAIKPHGCSH